MTTIPNDLSGQLLNQRFQVNQPWQKTTQSILYHAIDLKDGKEIWLECTPLTPITQKHLPHFQRQAHRWDFDQLQHPAISRYLEYFTAEYQGQAYFCQAIRAVPCQSLAERLTEDKLLTPSEAIQILEQACRILLFLHHLEPPLWHQALEPACFLLTPQKELLLTGFGLQRVEKGTLFYPLSFESDYLALEQMRGEAGPAADIFGLGATLVMALTGRPLSQWPDRQFEKHPGISDYLAKLLRHLTEKDKSQRITSCDELRNAIKTLKHSTIKPAPVPTNHSGLWMLAAGLPLVLLISWWIFQPSQLNSAPEPTVAPSAITQLPPTQPSPMASITSEQGYFRLFNAPAIKTPLVVSRPTNKNTEQNWLTIVPAAAKETDWEQQLFLTDLPGDQLEFLPVAQDGTYEIRLYQSSSGSNSSLIDRLKFQVGLPASAPPPQILEIAPHQDFKRVDDDLPAGLATSQSRPDTQDKPLEALTGLPPDSETGEKTHGCFWLGNTADRCYAFMIHKDLLYVDKNNNEDLSDDGPSYSILRALIPFEVERVMTDGKTIQEPYHIWFFYNPHMNRYGMYARTYYQGEMNVGGLMYKMILFETENHNGLFRDDGIWIDINRNDQFENQEHVRHHQTVSLSNQTYEILLNTP